jgi:hypothetical protein
MLLNKGRTLLDYTESEGNWDSAPARLKIRSSRARHKFISPTASELDSAPLQRT